MSAWIDFKDLREKLSFEAVLRHYNVEVKRKGAQHQGFCPLPNHNGKKNSPSFSANLERGIFQCFGCGAKGNLLEFAALMEKADPKDGKALRKVAAELQQRFCGETPPEPKPKAEDKQMKLPEPEESEGELPVEINPPLDFELQRLDAGHPYLKSRGLTPETIRHFGLGYCSRGYFKDRIVIPLRDSESRLIGYSGRLVDDSKIAEHTPKYLFPGTRERSGRILEFRKGEFLYNGHRLKKPVDDLVVVEGFLSVHWLHQNGIPDVVALMGWACSEKQAELIVSHAKKEGRVWILSDGDEAGTRCAVSVFQLVAPHRALRWVKLDEGKQPTDYSEKELSGFLR